MLGVSKIVLGVGKILLGSSFKRYLEITQGRTVEWSLLGVLVKFCFGISFFANIAWGCDF